MENNSTINNLENNEATDDAADAIHDDNEGKAKPCETPYTLMKQIGSGKVSDEEMVKKLIEYNRNLVSLPGCKTFENNNKRKLYTSCTCLKVLMPTSTNDDDDGDFYFRAIATFQMYFGKMKKREQQFKVLDWVRYAHRGNILEDGQQRYFIPYMMPEGEEDDDDSDDGSDSEGDDDDDDDSMSDKVAPNKQIRRVNELNILLHHKICRNALMSILGIGFKWWRTVVGCVDNHKPPPRGTAYGRVGLRRKKFMEQEDELKEFFEYLKGHAQAVPSGSRPGQEGENIYYLEPRWSKMFCYNLYCMRRGKVLHTNGKFIKLTEDTPGIEAKSCIGRSTFRRYWDAEYPELRIRPDSRLKTPPLAHAQAPRPAKPGLRKRQQFKRFEEPALKRFFEELKENAHSTKQKHGPGQKVSTIYCVKVFGGKRFCYKQYCARRGKIFCELLPGYHRLEDEPGVVEPKSCISWTSFCRYWNTHYPDLETIHTWGS